jgi:hypothetical protein
MDWKRIVRQLKMFGVEPIGHGLLAVRCPDCSYQWFYTAGHAVEARMDFLSHWNWAHNDVLQTVRDADLDVRSMYQPYLAQNRGPGQPWLPWRTTAWSGP